MTETERRSAEGDIATSEEARREPSSVESQTEDVHTVGDEERIFVMRPALALIRLPGDQQPIFTMPEARELADSVCAALSTALEQDTRVSEVLEVPRGFDVDNARTHTFFEFDEDEDDLAEAVNTYQALRLNNELWFRIRVPAKNQPRYRSLDDVPADEYLVVWDGISLAVQWSQLGPRATGSGGHIVFEILEDVGRAAGYSVEILACSVGCLHRFVHADFVSFESDQLPDHFHIGGETPVGCTVVSPFKLDPDDVANLRRNYDALHGTLNQFAEAKATADSIAFMEARARGDSTEALAIAYERAARNRFPHVIKAAKDLWRLRSAGRRSRQLIAGLWLALASVDEDLGHWRTRLARLEELMDSRNLRELDDVLDPGRRMVERVDLTMVRAALQEMASRIEGRALVWATTAGAAAALAGAAVAALLT